jgi:hypothetical protein
LVSEQHQPLLNADIDATELLQQSRSRSIHEYVRIDEELNDNMRQHAGSACLSLCDTLQEKLPSELRDMVYEFNLDKPDIHISREHINKEHFDSRVI